jgi:SH3-like domain-containing protein
MRIGAGFCLLWVLALAACSSAPERKPALGEAWIGPLEHELREALTARSRVVARLRHGERVEIIGRRRRFYEVRTAGGAEGWIDGRLLLSAHDLAALQRLRARAAESPSQGRASVLDELNVHALPHRQAPSFRRIRPGQHAEVIAYERVVRRPYEPPPLPLTAATNGRAKNGPRSSSRRAGRSAGVPPLAPIPAPGLPDNWLELSRTERPGTPQEPVVRPASGSPPSGQTAVADDWALVRLEDGSAGWVLARMLFMEIPDEVAQYAERARIAAYFQIGSVRGRDGDRPVWLWATQSQRNADFDFDSLRIFVWNARRHRYETAFIERNLKGWLPLRLRRGRAGVEGFEAVVEEKGGTVVARTYTIQPGTFRTRLAGRTPSARPPAWLEPDPPAPQPAATQGESSPGWLARLRDWAGGLRARLSR